MSKKALVCGLAVVSVLVTILALREPMTERWHLSRLDSATRSERESAAQWLAQERSERAVPKLIALIDDRAADESEGLTYAARALVEIGPASAPGLIEALSGTAAGSPGATAAIIRTIGEIRQVGESRPSDEVALLVGLLDDPESKVRRAVTQALAKFGSAALPALREATRAESVTTRQHAVMALARMGKPALPVLLEVLQGEDRVLKNTVVGLWATLSEDSAELAGQLVDVLKSETDSATRASLVRTLIQGGPESAPAVLRGLAVVSEEALRRALVDGLVRQGVAAVRPLVEVLSDDDPADSAAPYVVSVLTALEQIHQLQRKPNGTLVAFEDPEVAPPIVALLESPQSSVRAQAVSTLREIVVPPEMLQREYSRSVPESWAPTPIPPSTVPLSRSLLTDESREIREDAAIALAALDVHTVETVSILVSLCSHVRTRLAGRLACPALTRAGSIAVFPVIDATFRSDRRRRYDFLRVLQLSLAISGVFRDVRCGSFRTQGRRPRQQNVREENVEEGCRYGAESQQEEGGQACGRASCGPVGPHRRRPRA